MATMIEWDEHDVLPSEVVGMLARDVAVRIVNFSGSGCLVESRCRVELGTIGTLRLMVGREEISDTVQIVRCQQIEGAGALRHVGLQFVWTSPPHPRTLRHVMRHGGEFACLLTRPSV
jgi:hypothetical protein